MTVGEPDGRLTVESGRALGQRERDLGDAISRDLNGGMSDDGDRGRGVCAQRGAAAAITVARTASGKVKRMRMVN